MRKFNQYLIALVVLCAFAGLAFQSGDAFQVLPGLKVGKISPRVDEDKLIKFYGQKNVQKKTIDYHDTKDRYATVIYPHTPNEVFVLWQDEEYFAIPDIAILRSPESSWNISGNVKVGVTLEELSKLNKKPIIINGFNGDKSPGKIIDWSMGTFNASLNDKKGVEIRLGYAAEDEDLKDKLSKLNSNKTYSSTDDLLAKYADKIFISEIVIVFPRNKK